jgi:hypothetical protein
MKNIILILVALFLTLSLKAQWSVGTSAGLTFGEPALQEEFTINGLRVDDLYDKKAGWLFDLSPGYALNERFHLDLQMRGLMRRYEDTGDDPFNEYRYVHAAVSPMLEWKFLPFMALAAGPVAEYLLLDQIRPADESGDWNDQFEGVTEQYNFGVNAGLHFFWRQFYMKCQYHHGLNDQQEIQFTDATGRPQVKAGFQMRSCSLALGYRWKFNKKGSQN